MGNNPSQVQGDELLLDEEHSDSRLPSTDLLGQASQHPTKDECSGTLVDANIEAAQEMGVRIKDDCESNDDYDDTTNESLMTPLVALDRVYTHSTSPSANKVRNNKTMPQHQVPEGDSAMDSGESLRSRKAILPKHSPSSMTQPISHSNNSGAIESASDFDRRHEGVRYCCRQTSLLQRELYKNTIVVMNFLARVLFWLSLLSMIVGVVWYSMELANHGYVHTNIHISFQ